MTALLLFEVDGYRADDVTAQTDAIANLCLAARARRVRGEHTSQHKEIAAAAKNYRGPQHALADAVRRRHGGASGTHPRPAPASGATRRPLPVPYAILSHAGDGNLRVHILKKPEMPLETWHAQLKPMLTDLYRIIMALGGTITGEHGIGSKHAPYLPLVQSAAHIALEQHVKAAFDPWGFRMRGRSSGNRCSVMNDPASTLWAFSAHSSLLVTRCWLLITRYWLHPITALPPAATASPAHRGKLPARGDTCSRTCPVSPAHRRT